MVRRWEQRVVIPGKLLFWGLGGIWNLGIAGLTP